MSPPAAPPAAVELGRRLLALVRAQSTALENEQLEQVQRLAAERAALQQRLESAMEAFGHDVAPALRPVLEEILAVDRRNVALTRSLMEHTAQALRQTRQGRGAHAAYARSGDVLLQRATLLDRLG
ncbi:MAG: flagellar protein FliT [Chloroflexi bacterium]|nr:flagellar protein FliT [Chloroflexota bacterium]